MFVVVLLSSNRLSSYYEETDLGFVGPEAYYNLGIPFKEKGHRTSLVVQWLRIHLPTQGMWV